MMSRSTAQESTDHYLPVPGTYALFPGGAVRGPMDGRGEVEGLSRQMGVKLRAVRIGVMSERDGSEVARIEQEILEHCRSLGTAYLTGIAGAPVRMTEQTLRVLCERLSEALGAALDMPQPMHRDANL